MPPNSRIPRVEADTEVKIICLFCGKQLHRYQAREDKAVCRNCERNVFEEPCSKWLQREESRKKIRQEKQQERQWKRPKGWKRWHWAKNEYEESRDWGERARSPQPPSGHPPVAPPGGCGGRGLPRPPG